MNDYWQKRIEAALARRDAAAAKALPELLSHMQEARRSLEKEINAFYARYAKNNRVTLAEAQRALSLSELADFRGDLKTFRKLAKNSIGRFDLEVDNLSVKARVTRLEALEAQVDAILQKCYQAQRELIESTAAGLAQEQYLHRLYDIEQYTGFQFHYSQLAPSRVEKMLQMPVNGADISASLWRQDVDTGFQIRRALANMFTTGRPPQDFAKDLQKIIGRRDAEGNLSGKSYEAYRLLYNEAAHITEQASMAAMTADGLEQYEVTAALDTHTCGVCQELDGKIYDTRKAVASVNMPPFHVNCRCTTVPYIPEVQEGSAPMRAARDPLTGKTVRAKAQSYGEWKAERERESMALAFKRVSEYRTSNGDFDLKAAIDEYKLFLKSVPEKNRMYLQQSIDAVEYKTIKAKNITFGYYSRKDVIYYNPTESSFWAVDFTAANTHELAHRIDRYFVSSEADSAFKKAILEAKSVIESDPQTFIGFCEKYDYDGFISDICDAVCESMFEFEFNHGKDYWAVEGNKEREIFANIFSLETFADKPKIEFIQKHFGAIWNAYKYFRL